MKIGIIGYGSMASALARSWCRAGREVLIGGRSADKAATLAQALGAGAQSGTIAEAVAFGDVVVPAVVHQAIPALLDEAAPAIGSKVLVDINNPVDVRDERLWPKHQEFAPSMAQWIQARLPQVRVVKAFNMAQASIWDVEMSEPGARRLGVPICGDDTDAKLEVARLVRDTGHEPHDVGPLHRAKLLEACASLVISQIFTRQNPRIVLDLVVPD